jgi:hypothetical protein
VSLLNSQLGAGQLSDEPSARLVQVVKGEPLDLTWGILGGGDIALWGTLQDTQDHLSQTAASNERILQHAKGFLGPEQLSALSAVLSNGIYSRISYAAAYTQKHWAGRFFEPSNLLAINRRCDARIVSG